MYSLDKHYVSFGDTKMTLFAGGQTLRSFQKLCKTIRSLLIFSQFLPVWCNMRPVNRVMPVANNVLTVNVTKLRAAC